MIPQTDPRAAYLEQREEIDRAIRAVLEGGRYVLGDNVRRLESEFAAYVGVKHGIGVASGTDAITIGLRALGIGPGSAVVTVSHTAVATIAAIRLAGAEPVLVDISTRRYTLDPEKLEATIRQWSGIPIRAIVPVHLYGHPADMEAIGSIAGQYGLAVLEDCAQAHGADLLGRKVGTWGNLSAFSFYPTKNLGGIGDGGMILTDDSALAERVHLLREYGWKERYVSSVDGVNSRLDELQAAILRVKLKALASGNERRRQIAARYHALLEGLGLALPSVVEGANHVYHQYVIRLPQRDGLAGWLAKRHVGTLVHYPVPVHLQPAYRGRVAIGEGGLEATETASRQVLSLPMYPQLIDDDVHRVGSTIRSWFDAQGGRS